MAGSSLRVLNEEFTRRPEQWGHKNVVHTVVPSYHDRPGYVNAMANLIAREVAEYTPEQQAEGVQVSAVLADWLLLAALPAAVNNSSRGAFL
ncbi:MAG: hypothetical protein SGPRY_014630 [Prymnesium sp.]